MIIDIALTVVVLSALSVPLAVTAWALLDAAKRPRWVWAYAGRRQVVWMAVIAVGVATVIGGLMISGWYLTRVRPQLASIESGNIGLSP